MNFVCIHVNSLFDRYWLRVDYESMRMHENWMRTVLVKLTELYQFLLYTVTAELYWDHGEIGELIQSIGHWWTLVTFTLNILLSNQSNWTSFSNATVYFTILDSLEPIVYWLHARTWKFDNVIYSSDFKSIEKLWSLKRILSEHHNGLFHSVQNIMEWIYNYSDIYRLKYVK